MNEEKLKFLVDQYLNGKATAAEEAELLHYYNQSQEYKTWQDELMGEQETVKKRLFKNITDSIAVQDSPKRLFPFSIRKIAAYAAVLCVIAGWLIYFQDTSFKHPGSIAEITKIAPAGGVLNVILSDGTHVVLNNGSEITFPKRFTGNKREVSLKGEAFFEVVHLKKPFIIHSGKMLTQVLGTSFNVKAYEGDKMARVTVLTGKVGVSVEGSKQQATFLTANQALVFDQHNHALTKSFLVDAAAEIAWRKRIIKFRSTPFPEALEELNRIYHIKVIYQEQLKNCFVFADFNYHDQPAKVLNMLAKSLNGAVVHQADHTYLITGRACN